ncbi:MAG: hypothetical protein QGM50_04295 [Anaerolineae bacterium]|nr:hypothetical protein [Anaerolineae bacterium]
MDNFLNLGLYGLMIAFGINLFGYGSFPSLPLVSFQATGGLSGSRPIWCGSLSRVSGLAAREAVEVRVLLRHNIIWSCFMIGILISVV